jgi:Flp pilus assembly protein TadG
MEKILNQAPAMAQSEISAPKSRRTRSLLAQLRANTAGNVAMIWAISLFPLLGMVGAGVDVSRAYLVKSRIQQACDAGALAGRKTMTGTTLTTAAEAQARAFFANNFTNGSFGATNIVFTPTLDADQQVVATASARIPMTITQIFNKQFQDISVRCDAKLEVGNTDVMLVLDITGSMNTGFGSGTRLTTMKSSVIDFYNVLGGGDPARGRIRYGIVPYGPNVNVGYSLPNSAIIGGASSDAWIFQTRVADMTTPSYSGTPSAPTSLSDETFGSPISQANCARYGNNVSFSQSSGSINFTGGADPLISGGPAPTATTSVDFSNSTTAGPALDWGWSTAAVRTGTNRTCRRHRTQIITTYTLAGYGFTSWTYKQASVDVTGYASGSPVTIFTGNTVTGLVPSAGQYDMRSLLTTTGSTVTGSTTSYTWNGCIEERDGIDTIDSTTPINVVPTGALDIDIHTVPTDNDSRWRAAWNGMVRNRNTLADATTGSTTNGSCPAARARKLMQYPDITASPTEDGSLSSFETYINGLTTVSGTIHDIGFVWGARFLTGNGLFTAENPDSFNGQPVSRHIVFLTDGQMSPVNNDYTFMGINELDQRIAPRGTSNTNLKPIHNRRLRIACEQAKAENVSIWIVIVDEGTPADYPDLLACASSPDQFKFAAEAADLNSAFQAIAAKIASLRLSR